MKIIKFGDSFFTFLSGGWKDELGIKQEFEEEQKLEKQEKEFKANKLKYGKQ